MITLRNTIRYNEVHTVLSIAVFIATTATVSLAMLPKVSDYVEDNKNIIIELMNERKGTCLGRVYIYNRAISKFHFF